MERIKKRYEDFLFYRSLIQTERAKSAWHLCVKELGKLLKKIKPKRIKGKVIFGTGDPASTGEIFGGIAFFYGMYSKELQLLPDFEEERLEGQVEIRGKIRLIHVLISGIRLFFHKDIQYVIRKIKAKEGA